MCRSFSLNISPSTEKGPDVEIYTYTPDAESASLIGQVWLELETTGVRVYSRLNIAEARAAAQGLLHAAAQAEADLAPQAWAGSSYRALADGMKDVTYAPRQAPRTSTEQAGDAA